MFTRVFGKTKETSSPAPVLVSDTTTPAQLDLAETLELTEKREAHVLRLIAKEVDTARSCAASNNRRAALEAVKRKKIHEKELERLSAQRLNLMQTEATLSQLKFNNVVLQATEKGAAAIEREVKKVKGADGVDRVLDRVEELMADADDILGCSSRKMGPAAELDDADLLDELEQMELASELCDLTDVGGVGAAASTAVPRAVPAAAPAAPVPMPVPRKTAAEIAEERELAELVALQSSMKMESPMPAPMAAAKVEQRMPMAMTAPSAMMELKIEQPMAMPMMAACY